MPQFSWYDPIRVPFSCSQRAALSVAVGNRPSRPLKERSLVRPHSFGDTFAMWAGYGEVTSVDSERMAGSAFGALLRRHRLAAGLSQELLAERARMSVNGIGALERGDRQHPYRETVVLLAKALGLTPAATAELEAAAARPRRRVPRVDPGAAADARETTTNLPYQPTSLIGREDETADILGMLRASRLVTVTGAGGIGKTRIALAVGDALVADGATDVSFVELAPVAQGSFVAAAVARALDVQESSNRPPLETLLAYLRRKSMLLILDNCEHVIAEAAALADALLRGCPNVRILATSRELLRIAGEQTYRLPSLRAPSRGEIVGLRAAQAEQYPAVVLFTERARALDRGFALSDDNAPIVAEICRRLDGIALAIELAAARVSIMPVRVLSAKLDQRLRILGGGDRTALPRHQTMRALIDWSYDLLSPAEQRLFERLSVFVGGCTLETATAVYADETDEFEVVALLSSLVDKSLVAADVMRSEPRYRLLETSRQYGYEKLVACGEAEAAAQRHAFAFLTIADRLERLYDSASDSQWLALAEPELENWRAALDWTLGMGGDIGLGQALAAAMIPVWLNFAVAEGRRWIRMALEHVDERTPTALRAHLEYAAAFIASHLGEAEVALAGSRRLVALYGDLAEPARAARAQCITGNALTSLGRVAEAEPLLRSALETARSLGKRRLVGTVLEAIAEVCAEAGDFSASRAYRTKALEIYHSVGAERNIAAATFRSAYMEFRAGNIVRAVELSEVSIAKFRELGHTLSFHTWAVTNLAEYLVACDRWVDARRRAYEALDLAQETQHDAALLDALQVLAAIATLSSPPSPETAARVAQLLGYVDARVAVLRAPRSSTEQRGHDRILAALHDKIGADMVATLGRQGATLTQDQAVEYALLINENVSTVNH